MTLQGIAGIGFTYNPMSILTHAYFHGNESLFPCICPSPMS
jgi:hypothetical protein